MNKQASEESVDWLKTSRLGSIPSRDVVISEMTSGIIIKGNRLLKVEGKGVYRNVDTGELETIELGQTNTL